MVKLTSQPRSVGRKLYILHLPTLVGRYIRTQLIHRNRLSVLRLRIFDRETCLVRTRIRVNCRGNNPELARVWLLTVPNQLISELVPAASFWSIASSQPATTLSLYSSLEGISSKSHIAGTKVTFRHNG